MKEIKAVVGVNSEGTDELVIKVGTSKLHFELWKNEVEQADLIADRINRPDPIAVIGEMEKEQINSQGKLNVFHKERRFDVDTLSELKRRLTEKK